MQNNDKNLINSEETLSDIVMKSGAIDEIVCDSRNDDKLYCDFSILLIAIRGE